MDVFIKFFDWNLQMQTAQNLWQVHMKNNWICRNVSKSIPQPLYLKDHEDKVNDIEVNIIFIY